MNILITKKAALDCSHLIVSKWWWHHQLGLCIEPEALLKSCFSCRDRPFSAVVMSCISLTAPLSMSSTGQCQVLPGRCNCLFVQEVGCLASIRYYLRSDDAIHWTCILQASGLITVMQEEVVREAEAQQSLLSEDASKAGVQKREDVSTGQLRRLLDASVRRRPASAPDRAAERPGPSNGHLI